MSSATSSPQPLDSFVPPLRLKLQYFRDSRGKLRGVAKMPGSGPTWISGYVSLPDRTGTPRLCACYIKVRGYLEAYESGLCVWNDRTDEFDRLRVLWNKTEKTPKQPPAPEGHPSLWRDPDGHQWVLFGNPFPFLRCAATFEAWQDPDRWEVIEPQPSVISASDAQPIKPHTGHIAWNEYRKRWVTVFLQSGGKPSNLGELWYAEADSPTGPWGRSVKVLSHDNYTFYNPRLHPEFTPANSPILIFEGTYTAEFADRPAPTPRYNYNQILYRLDLDDPALAPAHQRP